MNKFLQTIENADNKTARTLNNARSYHSTKSNCLDLFGKIGALRNVDDSRIISLWSKAWAEDPLKALKILFWARDVRGGQGERKVFRVIADYLAKQAPDSLKANLENIAFYGRWDDLILLSKHQSLSKAIVTIIEDQLKQDLKAEHPSLLAKWLPSVNTSSKETRKNAAILREKLGLTHFQYRKMLQLLRKKTRVVEQLMSNNRWKDIDYEKVPSRAAMIYRDAFRRHDPKGYQQFLDDVSDGKKEIKAGTLYPYDICHKALDAYPQLMDQTVEAQWKALPDFFEGKPLNGLVVADTSGSMTFAKCGNVLPIDISISLALYIAERNPSKIWQNKFISFSESPTFHKIVGSSITEKLLNLRKTPWGYNTDLQKVFDLVLDEAKANNVPTEDMPAMLLIISDMQLDEATDASATNFENIQRRYKQSGYEMPNLVFWNVNAIGSDQPMTIDDTGTCLVSGASPSILKSILGRKVITPEDIMNETVESERYNRITV